METAIQDGIKGGLGSAYSVMTAIAIPVAAVCVALCAFYIFTGGEKGMEKAKKILLYCAIGLAIVWLGPVLVQQVSSWFSSVGDGGVFNPTTT